MSKTNPDYVLRAQLMTQMLLSMDGPDYSAVYSMRKNGIDSRLLADLAFIAAAVIKASKE